jgi:hypothetical protein
MKLTAEVLKNLKMTANEPDGDRFVDRAKHLDALVDAFAADSSLASPMYLYLAAGTAIRIGRVEDAAFLYFAAQIRGAFDVERHDLGTETAGGGVAGYYGFLGHTIGQSVNPAIMRQPALFARAVARVESWDPVPARGAYYPEFEDARGFALDPPQWAARAAAIKEDFLSSFGRRYAALLADPRYAEAVSFVQDCNFGRVDLSAPAHQKRFDEARTLMERIERETPEG